MLARLCRGLLATAAFVLLRHASGWACAVCVGNPDDPQTIGMNRAILGLLVIVGGVLAAFAAFFIVLWRRSRNPLDPVVTYVDQLEHDFTKEDIRI